MLKIEAITGFGHLVVLEQMTQTLFVVTYGKQIKHKLSLRGAMKEFKDCVHHSAKSVESITTGE